MGFDFLLESLLYDILNTKSLMKQAGQASVIGLFYFYPNENIWKKLDPFAKF